MALHYKQMGSGPALIILHGLYGSGDNWFNIGKELSNYFTVYLVDQRNHGRSPHYASLTYQEMADDLDQLINTLQLNSFSLIGHSMGGKTAMTYTLQHGSKVDKLINVDISPFSYDDVESFSQQKSFHQNIIERFTSAPITKAQSRTEIENHFSEKIKSTQILRFLLKNLTRNNNGEFIWRLNVNAISNNLNNVIDAAPPVKMGAQSYANTLFIYGGKSPYINNDDMEAIKDIFPNSKFIQYKDSGHWLHSEETDRFISDTKAFLGV